MWWFSCLLSLSGCLILYEAFQTGPSQVRKAFTSETNCAFDAVRHLHVQNNQQFLFLSLDKAYLRSSKFVTHAFQHCKKKKKRKTFQYNKVNILTLTACLWVVSTVWASRWYAVSRLIARWMILIQIKPAGNQTFLSLTSAVPHTLLIVVLQSALCIHRFCIHKFNQPWTTYYVYNWRILGCGAHRYRGLTMGHEHPQILVSPASLATSSLQILRMIIIIKT